MNELDFSKKISEWYLSHLRDLPWRKTSDPYLIWVSEVMLQQTQVVTVIDYYQRFIEKYPDVFKLSQASEDEVFKVWEGLGYYRRARQLMNCAQIIVKDHKGLFPNDLSALKKLPGIGPYTAGAIHSIAFNQPSPAVDGNVMRVFSRFLALSWDISEVKNRKKFEATVIQWMKGEPSVFNQALMELGATVCKPKNPLCEKCPVSEGCIAFNEKDPLDFPVNSKKTLQIKQKMGMIILSDGEEFLIMKRPNHGLMANLWGFLTFCLDDVSKDNKHAFLEEKVKEDLGLDVVIFNEKKGEKHVFTHRIWEVSLFEARLRNPADKWTEIAFPKIKWVKKEELEAYPFATAFKKNFKWI